MDGDNHQRKQHDPSNYPSVPGPGHHTIPRQTSGSADRFGQPSLLSTRTNVSISTQGPDSRPSTYPSYGYTDQQSYGNSSLPSSSLQGGGLQYQTSFSSGSLGQQPAPRQHQQAQDYQQYQPPQQQPSAPQSFPQFGANFLYNVHHGQTPGPYEVVSQYPPPRQSAAIRSVPPQFSVSQYFPPNGQSDTGEPCVVSQYLNPQTQSAAYQQNPLRGLNTTQPVTAITSFNASGATEGVEPSERIPEPSNLDHAYNQYQHALRLTFDYTRAGRLMDASRSLLEISEWLMSNAREMGILRDEQELHGDRLRLWNYFNLCWLSVCQKQKDLTEDLLESGSQQPNTSMITVDIMERMGQELVRYCDKLEQYGLVDYQMGIWEEEILSVLSQCLDLLEASPEGEQAHDLRPAVTASSA